MIQIKIIVFSDSHGDAQTMEKVLNQSSEVDMVIHTGDGHSEFLKLKEKFPDIEMFGVSGNNDWRHKAPNNITLNVEDKKILVTHGHKYGVKSALTRLYFKALEENADLVLYGHTHCPALEDVNGIVFVNPGSIGYTVSRVLTYAIINIEYGRIKPIICYFGE